MFAFLLLVCLGLLLVRAEVLFDFYMWRKGKDDKPISTILRVISTIIVALAFKFIFEVPIWLSCLTIVGVFMWFDNILNYYRELNWRYHPPKNRWERFWGELNNFTYILLRSLILIISCILFFLL